MPDEPFRRFAMPRRRNQTLLCNVLLAFMAALLLAGCAPTESDPRVLLERMYASDQAYRAQLLEPDVQGTATFYFLWAKQEFNDWANLKALDRLVKKRGWPARSVVGDKAATAAFLVVQHASLARQKEYLPLLQAAVAKGEASADQLALLEDRILMREGKKQRYGSQLQPDGNGGWEFYPIEDEPNVDARRKAVGLTPIAEYASEFRIVYTPGAVGRKVPVGAAAPRD